MKIIKFSDFKPLEDNKWAQMQVWVCNPIQDDHVDFSKLNAFADSVIVVVQIVTNDHSFKHGCFPI